jgi:transposase
VNLWQIFNGIFYMLRSGGAWRLQPSDYLAWSTAYDYFRKWRYADIWEQMVRMLRELSWLLHPSIQEMDDLIASLLSCFNNRIQMERGFSFLMAVLTILAAKQSHHATYSVIFLPLIWKIGKEVPVLAT